VSPVKYELGFYIPEDDILHSHSHENPKSYICLQILCIELVARIRGRGRRTTFKISVVKPEGRRLLDRHKHKNVSSECEHHLHITSKAISGTGRGGL
jgi:hypothetical protein